MSLRLAFFLLLTLPALVAAGEADSKKSELQALHERLQNLQKEYQAAQENRQEVSDELQRSESAISETARQLHEMEAQLRGARRDLRQVKETLESTETRIRVQQEKLGRALRASYQRGQSDALRLILSGANPNQTARDLHYLAALSREQIQLIDTLRIDLARLEGLKKSAAEKSETLSRIQKARLAEQKKLLAEKRDRQGVLLKLSTQLKQQRREIETLKRDEARLTDLVEKLARMVARPARPRGRSVAPVELRSGMAGRRPVAVNAQTPEPFASDKPFSSLKGLLKLPVEGELMNRFGAPREEGGLSWKGLFIRAPGGADVKVVAPGQVVFSDWLRGFGNLIIVDHGEGYMSLYSNNESLYKQVGDEVRPGDVIAAVGNSGGQEEAGLYFEMRHQSRPFDPLSWVK